MAQGPSNHTEINFQLIVEALPDAIIILSNAGQIKYINTQTEKMFGCNRDQVAGANIEALLSRSYKDSNPEFIQSIFLNPNSTAGGEGIQLVGSRADGTEFPIEIGLNAIKTEDGIVIVATVTDATHQKQLEGNVKVVEKRFTALIENNYDIIALLDEKGLVTYHSPSAERLLGYSYDEIHGKPAISFFHPDDVPDIIARLELARQNPGLPMFRRNRMKHKDGHYIWTEGNTTNLLEDENVRAFVGNFRDISERKIADEKLMKANRLYAFISEINQCIVHDADEHTIFDKACRIATEIGKFTVAMVGRLDYDLEEINAAAQSGLYQNEDIPFSKIPITRVQSTVHILNTNTYFLCNDLEKEYEMGIWRTFADKYQLRSSMVLPLYKSGRIYATFNLYSSEKNFFDHEEIALLLEAAEDISFALDLFEKEKVKTEMEALVLHNEHRLNQAQAVAHLGSWEMNLADGKIILTEEACRIYGLDVEDKVHSFESYLSFIHPEDVGFVLNIVQQARDNFANFSFRHRIVRKNGDVRYIFSQAEYEFSDTGQAVGMYGVEHDETEIKEAQNALEQSEANLRMIMDLIPQSIFAKDYAGKFVYANKSFAALYGLTPEQLINKNILDIIPIREEGLEFLKTDQNVIQSGATTIVPEQPFTDYEGRVHHLHTVKVPFTVAGTNQKAILGVLFNVTEQKQRDEERTKIIADIVQRNKDLEQFSYIVSHNLRAPVANIIGIADVMELPGLTDEDKKYLFTNLFTSVKKLDDVIMDLNYILQLKEGVHLQKEPVNFSGLIDDIELSILHVMRIEHVEIKSDFSEIDEMITLKSYLYSIFYNLITNSIKYRQTELQPVIEIASRKHVGSIELIFRDNGLGIDLEKKGDQIFGLYKRFHSFGEGKGMGLFMVKTQVETLGGTISITSEVNKGTEFRINFPVNN